MISTTQTPDLRSEVDRLISGGTPELASACLSEFWRKNAGAAAAPFMVSRFEKLRGRVPLVPFRLAFLRSFTLEPLIPLLRAEAFVRGIDLATNLGEFN